MVERTLLQSKTLKNQPMLANKRGQIFPFLVMVIIIMLVLVMAFINTSQVNLRELYTMNAADAGAMAGAAQIATAANAIADINVNQMLPQYLTDLGSFGATKPLDPISVWGTFVAYHSVAENAILTFYAAMITGYKGVQQGGGTAISTALQNIPIEEAQQRATLPVVGEVILPSPLQAELDRQLDSIYTDDSNVAFEYTWHQHSFNLTDQVPVFGERVRIDVNKPSSNALELSPLPMSLLMADWALWIPPCVYVDGCSVCAFFLSIATLGLTEVEIDMVVTRYTIQGIMFQSPLYSFIEGHNMAGAMTTISSLFSLYMAFPLCFPTSIAVCPPGGTMMAALCLFAYPVPFLLYMDNNVNIDVTVERESPRKNLGLFTFKKQNMSSYAKAGLRGGNVWSPGSYDIELKEVR